MPRRLYVYILTSADGILYVGVTNSLTHRIWQHRNPLLPCTSSFTGRHNIRTLVHFETFDDPRAAIAREKEIKGWKRKRKVALVERENPRWKDLGKLLGISD